MGCAEAAHAGTDCAGLGSAEVARTGTARTGTARTAPRRAVPCRAVPGRAGGRAVTVVRTVRALSPRRRGRRVAGVVAPPGSPERAARSGAVVP